MTRIVVFAGQAGNGKDTAAQALLDRGWTRAPLAGTLKAMLKTLLVAAGEPGNVADRAIDGDLKATPFGRLGGHTPRHAMQTLGTEWGRKCLGETFWLDTWKTQFFDHRHPEDPGGLVVTDCRFANEAEYLKALGAEIYVIRRPGFFKAAEHASEDLSWASGYPIIWNDGSVEQLHSAVRNRVLHGL